MNIKEKIGQRIQEERKARGLTRKALAELTDDLKQSRINNWERGERTPGPEEIKQLARALEISPAYLMCLTDEKTLSKELSTLETLIPLLSLKQAQNYEIHIHNIKSQNLSAGNLFVPVSQELVNQLKKNAFALKIFDDSMNPELQANDTLVIDPDLKAIPGCLVLAKNSNSSEIFIRKLRQISVDINNSEFELIAINTNWPNTKIINQSPSEFIIGTVVTIIRNVYPNFNFLSDLIY